MNAEEGQLWVWDGIDECLCEIRSLRAKHPVITAERHNGRVLRCRRHHGDFIRVLAGARDQVFCTDVTCRRLQQYPVSQFSDLLDFKSRSNSAAVLLDLVGICSRNALVIDDSRLRRIERLEPYAVRLNLLEPLWTDHLEPWDAVLLPALEDVLEPRQLIRLGGHDDLPANVVGNVVPIAELAYHAGASDTELSL